MQTNLYPQVTFVVYLFPTAGQPVWDPICQEWCLTDSDGISYLGSTPGECCRQFVEALHYLAEHARRSLYGVEDLLNYRTQQADDLLPLDHLYHP
jgi:hypothetical protein